MCKFFFSWTISIRDLYLGRVPPSSYFFNMNARRAYIHTHIRVRDLDSGILCTHRYGPKYWNFCIIFQSVSTPLRVITCRSMSHLCRKKQLLCSMKLWRYLSLKKSSHCPFFVHNLTPAHKDIPNALFTSLLLFPCKRSSLCCRVCSGPNETESYWSVQMLVIWSFICKFRQLE